MIRYEEFADVPAVWVGEGGELIQGGGWWVAVVFFTSG